MSPVCDWCGREKERMTEWRNDVTGEGLHLCFHGCQHFPEPFRKTKAGEDWAHWRRVDPYQGVKRAQPGLRGMRTRR